MTEKWGERLESLWPCEGATQGDENGGCVPRVGLKPAPTARHGGAVYFTRNWPCRLRPTPWKMEMAAALDGGEDAGGDARAPSGVIFRVRQPSFA